MKKKIDVAIAFFNFLKAARNRVKEGMGKAQILDFVRREFGEVSKLLKKQIDDLFKAKPTKTKPKKEGDVVPIKEEGIVATDKARDIVKKRTKDIATGDPTGETSEIMEGLATSINKLKKAAKELEDVKIDPIEEVKKMLEVQQSMRKGGGTYKEGNIRTAVREFMQS